MRAQRDINQDTGLYINRSALPSPGLEVCGRIAKRIPFNRSLKKLAVRHRLEPGASKMMDFFRQKRVIFVRVPKNASTSLCQYIYQDRPKSFWPGHLSAECYRVADPAFYDEAVIFAPLRNPIDRFRSAFNYYKRSPFPSERAILERTLGQDASFETFLEHLDRIDQIERLTIMRWHHFRRQADFITDKTGKVIVDILFPIEDLDPALELISDLLHISGGKITHRNASQNFADRTEIPASISDYYAHDFNLWQQVYSDKVFFVEQ